MKKLLSFLSLLLLLAPSSAYAAINAPWNATSTDAGAISPTAINGNNPYLKLLSVATSTFSNGLNISNGCFAVNGTCIGSGSGPSFGYPFPSNATSTLLTLSGGLTTGGTVTLGSLTGVLHGTSGVVSASAVDLTSDVTNTLPVANGGTGTNSFTAGARFVISNGTGAFTSVAAPLTVSNGGTGSTTLTGLLKGNGTGILATATGNTDYQLPISLTTTGTSGAATFNGTTLNIPQYAGTTYTAGTGLTLTGGAFSVNTSQNITTLSNLTVAGFVQTTSGGVLSSAALTSGNITTALGFTPFGGTNPLPVANGGTASTTLTGILKGNGTGAVQTAVVGTDYQAPISGTTGQNVIISPTNTASATSTIFTSTASNVGVGTTTPVAKLTVSTSVATSDALDVTNSVGSTTFRSGTSDAITDTFAVASSTTQVEFGVDSAGHNWTGGLTPTLTSCGGGTPAVTGDDNSGTITLGTGLTAACTLTFKSTWAQTPTCSATADAAGAAGEVTAISTTAVTFGVTVGNAGGKVYYSCRYHHT